MLLSKVGLGEAGVELSCDVALEAADGFGLGLAFGASTLEVVAGWGVVGEAGDDDSPQGAVGLTITGSAEAMPSRARIRVTDPGSGIRRKRLSWARLGTPLV